VTTANVTAQRPVTAASPGATSAPAEQVVNDILQGAWKARAVHVAVELGIPDLVAKGPVGSVELAEAVGAHQPSLRKLLRLLATVGVLADVSGPPARDGDLVVGPTELSEVLRANPTGVVATDARFQATMWHWRAWGHLEHSIRTGEQAFEPANGRTFWELTRSDEDAAARFNAAMGSVSLRESEQILQLYDFRGSRHVVDVGGGVGSLLSALLRSSPDTRGTLLERPSVAERAEQEFAARGLADRVQVIGGDFHQTIPAGADTYVIKHVLHDWADADVVRILRLVRDAMTADSRLLIIDNIVDENATADTLFVDLLMLVLVGGGDRSEQEFTDLARQAGLAVQRSAPAGPGALRFLECRQV